MTYLHNLAKRISSRLALLTAAAAILSCEQGVTSDLLTPIGGSGEEPAYLGLSVSPRDQSINVGDSLQLHAWGHMPGGDTIAASVKWVTSGGTINPSGWFNATAAGTFQVRAISQTRRGLEDSVAVTVRLSEAPIARIVRIDASPDSFAASPGATQAMQVVAQLSDGSQQVVTGQWTATGGTITPSGTFTAGQAPGDFQAIVSVQDANGQLVTDSVRIRIAAPAATLTQLSVTPAQPTAIAGTAIQFAASGSWSDGSSVKPAVTWSASGGSVDAAGLYRAGTIAGHFSVTATAQQGGRAATSQVTIIGLRLTALVLTPKSTTLQAGGSVQFAAATAWNDGLSHPSSLSYSTTGGTITSSGLYRAGGAVGSFLVIVTCTCGPADTAHVTVQGNAAPVPVLQQLILTPSAVSLAPGGTQQFTAAGTWSDGSTAMPAATYSVTGGTMTSDGRYTAGLTPGEFQVIAQQTGGTKADTSTVAINATTLRQLASARGFQIGAAVRDTAFSRDAAYRQVLATQYNSIVPEDATDFWPIHPGPNQYSFAAADALVSFAQANGMTIHGHSLVWYSWIPTWVTAGGYSDAQIRDILRDHIMTVVGRYRGKIASWDVANEVIDNQQCCSLQRSFWLDRLGPEYIDSAFVWAHRADPAAKLYLDDYATELINPKSNALLALAVALKSRGVPIDGVGFQSHILHVFPAPTSAQIQANFARFANAGFGIRITEMDVDVSDAGSTTTLASQGATYAAVLDACLRVPRCTELTTWGFTDRFNWVPQQFPGFGRAMPFDANYRPKPAFDSLRVRLGNP